MHLGNVTAKEGNELGLALRWSYGSVFGIWHRLLHVIPLRTSKWSAGIHPPVGRPAPRTRDAELGPTARGPGRAARAVGGDLIPTLDPITGMRINHPGEQCSDLMTSRTAGVMMSS